MPEPIAIADTPDALTPEWLTAALGRSLRLGDARVEGVTATPVGTGQMCDSIRLELTWSGEGDEPLPASVIAKLPAADPTSRGTALSLRSYEIEVRFYQQLAPHLPVRTPHVHHADIDVATASFVLLFEDLAPATQGDQLVGCTVAEAEVALDELVGLHAPRWGDPSLADIEWLHRDPELSNQLMGAMLPMLWDGFRDRYGAGLDPAVAEAGGELFAHLPTYLQRSGVGPLTVTHRDFRLDNLLFPGGDAGGRVAVVDWQTSTHGQALADVAYFIGAGLTTDDRRPAEVALVERYHGAVSAAVTEAHPGTEPIGWERCWEDYRLHTFAGLITAVAASMLVERTERGDEMFLTMATRHSHHALDHDAPALLR